VVRATDSPVVMLDLGTGARLFGDRVMRAMGATDFHAVALLSHLHWDHIQGLPFFAPIHCEGNQLEVMGPSEVRREGSLRTAVCDLLRPPYFPIDIAEVNGQLSFSEIDVGARFDLGRISFTAGDLPHCGPNLGYRMEFEGASVCYMSDHQEPTDGSIADSVLELARDVDVLIHDAQYTRDELETRSDWGHSSVDYAVHVARRAGARCLVMFHHDPAHDDDKIDEMHARAVELADGDLDVLAAHEGMVIDVLGRAKATGTTRTGGQSTVPVDSHGDDVARATDIAPVVDDNGRVVADWVS